MFDAYVKRAPRIVESARVALSLLAVLLLGAAAPRAQKAHKHVAPATQPVADAAAQPRIPDVNCVDQNGKKLRFHTDLVKGKVVVINFIYTSCPYLCTRIGESTARLQTALGDRLGRDVHLISVSIDPLTDTPEKLKAWAARLKAKDGWTLVTGEKAEIDRLLRVLTGDASGIKTHSPLLLIGNEAKNVWAESYAFENPAKLIQQIDRVSGAAPTP
jgi:protein SCO1/2